MGLLDDAIREHLDLKRRRGADPTEIAREETEALGPVRRGEVELADAAAAPQEAAIAEPDGPDEPIQDLAAPVLDDHAPNHVEPYPETEAESATPPHGDPLHQPTREFSAHELDEALGHDAQPDAAPPADAEPAEGDDVLGATPEFLQETPEHDRLWFEQKPPKDFDF